MFVPRLFLVCLVLFCSVSLSAQSDSLLNEARNPNLNDTARVELYARIAGEMGYADSSKVFRFFNEASAVVKSGTLSADKKEQWTYYVIARQADWLVDNNRADSAGKLYAMGIEKIKDPKNRKFRADQLVEAGYVIIGKGKYLEGIEFNTSAAEIYTELKDSVGLGQAYNNIAFMYQQMGISETALEFYYKSLSIRKAINDYSGVGESYTNISYEYYNIGETDTALQMIDFAIENRLKTDDKKGTAKTINTKGFYLQNLKRYDEAMECFRKAAALWIEVNGVGDPRVTYNIGFIFKMKKQYDSTLYYFNLAYDISRKMHDIYSEIYVLNGLATISLEQDKLEDALNYSRTSYDLAKTLGSINELRAASLNLSSVYKKKGDFENALFYTTEYYKYRDSLNTTVKQKSLYKQEAKFRYEQNMLALQKEQELKDAVTASENQRKNLILIFTIAGLVLVIIFAGFILNRFRITRRQKATIEIQKQEVETQKQMLEVKNTEILDSISYARRLQEAILPPDSLLKASLPQSFVLYMPKDIVAGDFYWMEKADGYTFFAVADCTGHGVPGALVSVVCSNALNRAVKEFKLRDTGLILNKARELVIETFAKSESNVMDGMDISIIRFTEGSSELQCSGAHNPIWIISNGVLQEIKADKQPIGQTDHPKPFASHTVGTDGIDALYLFTDGYADQFGGDKGKKFRYKQLEQLLTQIHDKSAQEQEQTLRNRILEWKGNLEQVDDICVAGIILK